jgi:hypothetical protein
MVQDLGGGPVGFGPRGAPAGAGAPIHHRQHLRLAAGERPRIRVFSLDDGRAGRADPDSRLQLRAPLLLHAGAGAARAPRGARPLFRALARPRVPKGSGHRPAPAHRRGPRFSRRSSGTCQGSPTGRRSSCGGPGTSPSATRSAGGSSHCSRTIERWCSTRHCISCRRTRGSGSPRSSGRFVTRLADNLIGGLLGMNVGGAFQLMRPPVARAGVVSGFAR